MTDKRDAVESRIRDVNEELKDLSDNDLLERGVQLFHEIVDVYLEEERNVCGALECDKKGASKCSGCNVRGYCCQEHQKEHWKVHKKECKELKGMASLREASHEYCERLAAVNGCSDVKARKKLRKEERKAKEKLEGLISQHVNMSASIVENELKNKLDGFSSVLSKLTFLSYVIDGYKALRRKFVVDALRHAAIIATEYGWNVEETLELRRISLVLARNILNMSEDFFLVVDNIGRALLENNFKRDSLFVEAIVTFKEAHRCAVVLYAGKRDGNVAASLGNLARAYESLGVYELAMIEYEKVLKMYENMDGYESEVAQTLANMGSVHLCLGEYELALRKCEEALKMNEAKVGEQHEHVADMLNSMALIYHRLGEYGLAMRKFKKAQNIYVNLCANEDACKTKRKDSWKSEESKVLKNMADLYTSLGEYDSAIEMYENALKIRKDVYGAESKEYADTLSGMATVYDWRGDHGVALWKYAEALEIYKSDLNGQDVRLQIGLTHSNMANLYLARGEWEQALRLNESAFKISMHMKDMRRAFERLCRVVHVHICSCGLFMSQLNWREELQTFYEALSGQVSGANAMALDAYREIVEHMSQLSLCDNDSGASILLDAAEQLKEAPLLAIRMQFLRRAVHVSGDVSDRCRSLTALATCLSESGLYLRALEHAQEAVALGNGADAKNLQVSIEKELKNLSKLVDMDILAQLERLQEGWMELQMQIVEDLRDNRSSVLSSFARNRTTELLVAASNLLDQVFSRLVRKRSLGKQGAKMKEMPFEVASSEKNFKRKMIKSKLWGVAPSTLDGAVSFAFPWDRQGFLKLLNDKSCWISRDKSGNVKTLDLSKLTGVADWETGGQFAWCREVLMELVAKGAKKKSKKKIGQPVVGQQILLPRAWNEESLLKELDDTLYACVMGDLREAGVLFGDSPAWWNIVQKDNVTSSCLRDYIDLDNEALRTGQRLPLREWRRGVNGLEAALLARICINVKQPDPSQYVDFASACPKSWTLLQDVQSYKAWEKAKTETDDEEAKRMVRVGTWLVKTSAIANDAKHMRLTPQSVRNVLRSERGLLPERDVKVMIDYMECLPQLYDWSVYDALSSTRASEYELKAISEASRVLRYKAFGADYFEKWHVAKVPFDRLAHPKALEVLRANRHKREEQLKEFENIVRNDVNKCEKETWSDGSKCMDVDAFADDAWAFIRARTLRLDPLVPLSDLEPDFRIDVHEFIPKVLEEVRRVALTFGEEQEVGGRAAQVWSGHIVSSLERSLNEATRQDRIKEVAQQFKTKFEECRLAIEGAEGGSVDLQSVSNLFDATRVLASAYTLCGRWEDAGQVWATGAHAINDEDSHRPKHMRWWWLVTRMREKAVRCLLAPARESANARAFGVQLQLVDVYASYGLYDRAVDGVELLAKIAPRAMDNTYLKEGGADTPNKRLLLVSSAKRQLRTDLINEHNRIDLHVYEQLHHCRSQLTELRYEAFRVSVAGDDRRRLLRALCLASEIAVKCRHVLDQALTRFGRVCIGAHFKLDLVNCKFPLGGSEEGVVTRLIDQLCFFASKRGSNIDKADVQSRMEQKYANVLSVVKDAQTYAFAAANRYEERWYDELVRWSNELKHERMQVPSEEDLKKWRDSHGDVSDGFLFIRLRDERFFPWSFAFGGGCDTVAESSKVVEELKRVEVLAHEEFDDGMAGPLLLTSDEDAVGEKVREVLRSVREEGRNDDCPVDEQELRADATRITKRLMQYVRGELYDEPIGLEALLQRAVDGVEKAVRVMYDAVRAARIEYGKKDLERVLAGEEVGDLEAFANYVTGKQEFY